VSLLLENGAEVNATDKVAHTVDHLRGSALRSHDAFCLCRTDGPRCMLHAGKRISTL
jgi:hypothetical protein